MNYDYIRRTDQADMVLERRLTIVCHLCAEFQREWAGGMDEGTILQCAFSVATAFVWLCVLLCEGPKGSQPQVRRCNEHVMGGCLRCVL